MTKLSKYEIVLEEINSLEKQFSRLVIHNKELLLKSEGYELVNKQLLSENSVLNKKLIELEEKIDSLTKVNNNLQGNEKSLITKDKDSLKLQINELISKIDVHLRS
ncbi:MAG: hypothetical protein WCJ01_09425 [Ignavibacteria bacterium]